MSPRDAEPVASIWIEQLNHAGIAVADYEMLFQKAIDWRIKCLEEAIPAPALTVETIIAVRAKSIYPIAPQHIDLDKEAEEYARRFAQ